MTDLPFDVEDVEFDGEPDEALELIDERIDELLIVLRELDEDHPQTNLVEFELATLEALRDQLREQEGDE